MKPFQRILIPAIFLPAVLTGSAGCSFTFADGDTSTASSNTTRPCYFANIVERIGNYRINSDYVYENKDISAIARITATSGIIAADEGRYAQMCTISQELRTITITDPVSSIIPLLSGRAGTEIDLEAATAIKNTYYLTGSHGLAKITDEYQPARHNCFRFAVDPETAKIVSSVQSSNLDSILQNDPVLGPYYKKSLHQNGVNIEGLAAKVNLYFGLRAPNLNGFAYIIEIDPNELFSNSQTRRYKLHSVLLGEQLGIREITAIESGFLIIAGPASPEPQDDEKGNSKSGSGKPDPNTFYLFFWDGLDSVQKIAPIPLDKKGYKAEAMLLLTETDSCIDLLILFDGPKGADPTVYRIYIILPKTGRDLQD